MDKINEIQIYINGRKWRVIQPILLIQAFACLEESYIKYDTKFPQTLEEAWDCANSGMVVRRSKDYFDESQGDLKKIIPRDRLNKYRRDVILRTLGKFDELRNKDKLKGIGITTFTKLLHRFFQGNFPLIDSTITKLYNDGKDTTDKGKLKIIKKIMKEYEKNKVELEKLEQYLKRQEVNLTTLRIFDILIWIKAKIFIDSHDAGKLCEGWFFEEIS